MYLLPFCSLFFYFCHARIHIFSYIHLDVSLDVCLLRSIRNSYNTYHILVWFFIHSIKSAKISMLVIWVNEAAFPCSCDLKCNCIGNSVFRRILTFSNDYGDNSPMSADFYVAFTQHVSKFFFCFKMIIIYLFKQMLESAKQAVY